MASTASFGDFYGSPRNRQPSTQGATKGSQKGAKTDVVNSAEMAATGVTGLELPMLIALGGIAWFLYRALD